MDMEYEDGETFFVQILAIYYSIPTFMKIKIAYGQSVVDLGCCNGGSGSIVEAGCC